MHLFKHKDIQDDELFIDFKLDLHTNNMGNQDAHLFNLLRQSRPPEHRGNRDDERRGREHETMPYFLTSQFREILETSQKQQADHAAN